MSRRSLNHFLYGQRIGELDSQGEFTLNSAEALRKLAHHQLANPTQGLIKLMQAGVRLGASEIGVSVTGRSAVIRFYETASIDGRDVGRSLMAGELPEESWKLHLIIGLRALISLEPVELSWLDSDGRWTSIGEGRSSVERLSASFLIHMKLQPLQGISRWLARDPFQLSQLSYHCQLCHIPIRVNGTCISRQFPPQPGGRFTLGGQPIALALESSGTTPLPLALSDYRGLDRGLSHLPEPRLEPHRIGSLAVLTEGRLIGGGSYCYFVKDGVLLHPRPLDFRFQSKTFSRFHLCLYLDGQNVKVALSQFHPLETDLDFLPLQVQLRRLVMKMDLSSRLHRQPGWNPRDRAVEDQRALIEAIDWLKFSD